MVSLFGSGAAGAALELRVDLGRDRPVGRGLQDFETAAGRLAQLDIGNAAGDVIGHRVDNRQDLDATGECESCERRADHCAAGADFAAERASR